MHVDIKITNDHEYFELQEKEVDWENEYPNNPSYVSLEQAELLQNILTCEASIFLLRRATGTDGYHVDDMVQIRARFIKQYEEKYEKYVSHNDYY